jgi:membrane-associated phospholipid phosphatase
VEQAQPATQRTDAALRWLSALYLAAVAGLVYRIAYLDDWSVTRWVVLAAFVATLGPDLVRAPKARDLLLGVAFFAGLSAAVTYLPDLWFSIAWRLHHGEHYLIHANPWMASIPGNDASLLWSHRTPWLSSTMAWIYENGFDIVVWIPVLRSLLAFDAKKMARYALSAHLVQFPMIMPFYATIRVDEVWSVLGHSDLLQRGWTDEQRLSIGANCFPSMHTSVAFAVMLLALREKSVWFRYMMVVYSTSIILSTMYMEVHWVIDVLAGLALGYAAVKLVDKAWPARRV